MVSAAKEALRGVAAFADLPDDQLDWFVEHSTELSYEPGEIILHEGDPAEFMFVVFEGELRFQASAADGAVFIGKAGQVMGMLPYSRLTRYIGTAKAIRRVHGLRFHKDLFPEMLTRIPALGPRLVAVMSDRIRESSRLSQQRDKLMALGKLSAGLSHELNNPASAARHAASALRDCLNAFNEATQRLAYLRATDEQSRCIAEWERLAKQQLASSVQLDSIERSDREESVSSWLGQQNVEKPWQISPPLVDAGFDVERLAAIADRFPSGMLEPILARVGASLAIERLLQSIEHSTQQITFLVESVKEYTYMDQAPVQEVDIHRGLESTLTMLGHCINGGIQVSKTYAQDLPRVCAWGSELNQVWTNLMENALEAMGSRGTLRIRTAREVDLALVEIGDDGPGIGEAIKDHIFEPFFTTKEVGSGMGLGLDTVYRIVQKHHGHVSFASKPRETVFQVRLPFVQPTPETKTAQ